jgi:hypothetical protein
MLVVCCAGYWKGTLVAVKTMMFPAAMSGKEKREKMAIMETAISASLSHPNIVQVCGCACSHLPACALLIIVPTPLLIVAPMHYPGSCV